MPKCPARSSITTGRPRPLVWMKRNFRPLKLRARWPSAWQQIALIRGGSRSRLLATFAVPGFGNATPPREASIPRPPHLPTHNLHRCIWRTGAAPFFAKWSQTRPARSQSVRVPRCIVQHADVESPFLAIETTDDGTA